MLKERAIVHPGAAHRDECLAIGLAYEAGLLAATAPVYRREPTVVEHEDPEILVLDVGGRHEPDKGNYDHHQLARGTRECALSLLAKATVVKGREPLTYHDLFLNRPWYSATVIIDSCGPFAMAKELGLGELPKALGSPFEWAVLDAVEQSAEVPGWVKELLAKIMADRTRDALALLERTEWLSSHAELKELSGLAVLVVGDKEQLGINEYREKLVAAGHDVAISVTHDDRGAGWSLYRFNDHQRVDFSRLEGEAAVLFAHKGGFIAKTRERLPIDAVMALVEKSLR